MSHDPAALVARYDPALPPGRAVTPPAAWYFDPGIAALEARTVFARHWQVVARVDQVAGAGDYVACEVAGEPVLVVRGDDGVLRGFFNVCRHHAAAVVADGQGCAHHLRCPYHGWTYALDGRLKGTPGFDAGTGIDRAAHGLVAVDVATWERWVFVRLDREGPSLEDWLGADLRAGVAALGLDRLHWFARRHYLLDCNWKVFVDNYLDGGYHVPHLHKGLGSVVDMRRYTVENGARHCLQSAPMVQGEDARFAAVRGGTRAAYYWLHPNFMINHYAGTMDTNLVRPLGPERTEVVFDFWFEDVSGAARAHNEASIAVGDTVQEEDAAICHAVQRGLRSRAYDTGPLSPRREAGEHLFHRLLHGDLQAGLAASGRTDGAQAVAETAG